MGIGMVLTGPDLAPARSVFDGWRSISLALYMTLVGYAVLVGVPVISTAWVELLGFTEEQVGRVAGADLGGLSLGLAGGQSHEPPPADPAQRRHRGRLQRAVHGVPDL
jgi:hypothetical protein